MKKIILCACIVATTCVGVAFSMGVFTKKRSKEYLIGRLKADLPRGRDCNVLSVEEAKQILSQPFYFLDKGKQVAAFKSHDGRYVLKCVMRAKFRLGDYAKVFSLKVRTRKKFAKKKKRLEQLRSSLALSSALLGKETATLYTHLYKTDNLGFVTLIDKRGNMWKLNANDLEFVIQKRVELLKPTLIGLMYEGKVTEAKQCLVSVMRLLTVSAKKGLCDTDGAVVRNDNIGFLDREAILIDAGKLVRSKKIQTTEGFSYNLRRLRPLHKWLASNYPELATFFEQEQKQVVAGFEK